MTYHIKLQGLVGDAVIERLQRGWRWEGRPVKPAAVEALAVTEKNTWLEIVVPEARPRALKAVGDLVRHSVLKVSRVRLGRAVLRRFEDGRVARPDEGGDRRSA